MVALIASIFFVLDNPFFLCECTYVRGVTMSALCMCTCVQGNTPMHAEAREGHQVSCCVILFITPLSQGLSLNLDPGKWPASPRNPAIFHPTPYSQLRDYTWACGFTEHWYGCQNPNSGLYACTVSTPKHWTISPAPNPYFLLVSPIFNVTRNKQNLL